MMTEKKRPKRKRPRKPPTGPKTPNVSLARVFEPPVTGPRSTVTYKNKTASVADLAKYAQMSPGQRAQANVEMVFQQDDSNAEYFIKSIANLLSVALGYQVNEYAINVRTSADPKSVVLHIRWVRDGAVR